jgi:PAS domain-containing protein
LLCAMPLCISIVDEEGRFLFHNEALERLVGKDCLGKIYWEVCMDDGQQALDCPLR